MKKLLSTGFLVAVATISISAQKTDSSLAMLDTPMEQFAMPVPPPPPANGSYPSPYKLSWKADLPIITAGIGLTALGVSLIDKKKDLTPAQYAQKVPDNVWFFDRSNAGWFSKRADDLSYIPFQASFAMPVIMGLLDKKQRQNYGHVLVLYLETMSITGAMFTMAAGSVQRSRPFVYSRTNGLDDEYRTNGNNQRSFYAGHTAATAAATFYTAKVFADFHPDSKAKPYVWAAAAAVPALVGYWRYKAGMHFLSDNILGFAIGAGTGILVPHFHKHKIKNLSMVPQFGDGYRGVAFTYKVK